MLLAVLTGKKDGLSSLDKDLYARAGLSHLLAVQAFTLLPHRPCAADFRRKNKLRPLRFMALISGRRSDFPRPSCAPGIWRSYCSFESSGADYKYLRPWARRCFVLTLTPSPYLIWEFVAFLFALFEARLLKERSTRPFARERFPKRAAKENGAFCRFSFSVSLSGRPFLPCLLWTGWVVFASPWSTSCLWTAPFLSIGGIFLSVLGPSLSGASPGALFGTRRFFYRSGCGAFCGIHRFFC